MSDAKSLTEAIASNIIANALAMTDASAEKFAGSTEEAPLYLLEVVQGPLLHNAMLWIDIASAHLTSKRFFDGGYLRDDLSPGGVRFESMSGIESMNTSATTSYSRLELLESSVCGVGFYTLVARLGLKWGLTKKADVWDLRGSHIGQVRNLDVLEFPHPAAINLFVFNEMIERYATDLKISLSSSPSATPRAK